MCLICRVTFCARKRSNGSFTPFSAGLPRLHPDHYSHIHRWQGPPEVETGDTTPHPRPRGTHVPSLFPSRRPNSFDEARRSGLVGSYFPQKGYLEVRKRYLKSVDFRLCPGTPLHGRGRRLFTFRSSRSEASLVDLVRVGVHRDPKAPTGPSFSPSLGPYTTECNRYTSLWSLTGKVHLGEEEVLSGPRYVDGLRSSGCVDTVDRRIQRVHERTDRITAKEFCGSPPSYFTIGPFGNTQSFAPVHGGQLLTV